MTDPISSSEDIIDSRDVIERIAELEGDDDLDQAEAYELDQLRSLADEASGYAPDWEYGEALIRDSYFEDYARELARELAGELAGDIGAIDPSGWPLTYIDWEAAADALKQDYTEIDFDGVSYWIR